MTGDEIFYIGWALNVAMAIVVLNFCDKDSTHQDFAVLGVSLACVVPYFIFFAGCGTLWREKVLNIHHGVKKGEEVSDVEALNEAKLAFLADKPSYYTEEHAKSFEQGWNAASARAQGEIADWKKQADRFAGEVISQRNELANSDADFSTAPEFRSDASDMEAACFATYKVAPFEKGGIISQADGEEGMAQLYSYRKNEDGFRDGWKARTAREPEELSRHKKALEAMSRALYWIADDTDLKLETLSPDDLRTMIRDVIMGKAGDAIREATEILNGVDK